MTDMLASAAAWLDGMRRQHLARWVSYTQAGVSAPCIATVSQSAVETQTEMGVIERWESRDYIISIADLPVDVPRRGDRISETLNSATVVYEVAAPRGASVWAWADSERTAYRIHTKVIDS